MKIEEARKIKIKVMDLMIPNNNSQQGKKTIHDTIESTLVEYNNGVPEVTWTEEKVQR